MANKDRKHKLNKQNKQRDNSKHELDLDHDLHFINQREEVIAEQLGIYDWSGW